MPIFIKKNYFISIEYNMSLLRNPNVFYGMGRRRRHRRRGGNILSAIGDAAGKAFRFLKDNHAISRAVGLIPHPLGLAGSLGLRALGLGRRRRRVRHRAAGDGRRRRVGRPRVKRTLGCGGLRRRRVYRRRRGGASLLSDLNGYAMKKHLLSDALHHFAPSTKLGMAAETLGYGRRRRRVRHRVGGRRRTVHRRVMHRHRGGANFFSTEQLAVPKF